MAGRGDEQRDGAGVLPSEGFGVNGDGLSWCWDLDMPALLAALSGPAPWQRATGADGLVSAAGPGLAEADVDPEAEEEAYQQALAAGEVRELPLQIAAGRVAESLPAGPGLAGWLAQARAADLEDGALAGVAASFRRLASWAAAGELAAIAQIASRSARSDRHAEVDESGRLDRITADATGQVALALAMSQDGASDWTDLAVVLTWRLPATGAALVTARDGTCRFGPCRRPAEQSDLDHTIPFDQGGLTCSCNLGGQCRSHHQLKQHPRWRLTQPTPGVFQWTTPAGRTYVVRPDPIGS